MMNRQLQVLLGLWINYQGSTSSKSDIMKQKQENYKQLVRVV